MLSCVTSELDIKELQNIPGKYSECPHWKKYFSLQPLRAIMIFSVRKETERPKMV
jgi:hypothetical protein